MTLILVLVKLIVAFLVDSSKNTMKTSSERVQQNEHGPAAVKQHNLNTVGNKDECER